ncbi:MotB family protein [Chthonobacter rhizosphaerae]|uniref:MotB family protein n=1 Tax=Chthonobacter rhizosphaerae TaxID=2735553 RepID=UPI0015EF0207|nr:MotB family protein [Chthonobacter rhizosphaerae]
MSELTSSAVIVRRYNRDTAEVTKGGAWKVAHADFMTAMMAFFLVMWLVNSTDEEVRRGVARYFNPIQLTETRAEGRGLNDPSFSAGAATDRVASQGQTPSTEPGGTPAASATDDVTSEVELFSDPYLAIETIAQAAKPEAAGEGPRSPLSGTPDGTSGNGVRDPFDPTSWTRPFPKTSEEVGTSRAAEADHAPSKVAAGADGEGAPDAARQTAPAARAGADGTLDTANLDPRDGTRTGTAAETTTGDRPGDTAAPPAAAPSSAAQSSAAQSSAAQSSAAQSSTAQSSTAQAATGAAANPANAAGGGEASEETRLEARIDGLRLSLAKLDDGEGPLVEVEQVQGGMLINLTDRATRSMFASGSASPTPELISAIDKIAAAVKSIDGQIIVRGHTDGRPFRSKSYDNWRLSTARAHMAAYMLVRGGVAETQIDHVEGHADRKLRRPEDPGAAENRRIEILVRPNAP